MISPIHLNACTMYMRWKFNTQAGLTRVACQVGLTQQWPEQTEQMTFHNFTWQLVHCFIQSFQKWVPLAELTPHNVILIRVTLLISSTAIIFAETPFFNLQLW